MLPLLTMIISRSVFGGDSLHIDSRVVSSVRDPLNVDKTIEIILFINAEIF